MYVMTFSMLHIEGLTMAVTLQRAKLQEAREQEAMEAVARRQQQGMACRNLAVSYLNGQRCVARHPSLRTVRNDMSCEELFSASSPDQAAEPTCVRLQNHRQALQVGVAMSYTGQAARSSAGRCTAGSAESGEAVHGGARLGTRRRRMVRCSTCQSPGPLSPASARTHVL